MGWPGLLVHVESWRFSSAKNSSAKHRPTQNTHCLHVSPDAPILDRSNLEDPSQALLVALLNASSVLAYRAQSPVFGPGLPWRLHGGHASVRCALRSVEMRVI